MRPHTWPRMAKRRWLMDTSLGGAMISPTANRESMTDCRSRPHENRDANEFIPPVVSRTPIAAC